MKKILWVEDNKGYVRGNLEELFGANLSASDKDELRNMEGEDFSLKIKPFLKKRNIFIEEEFSKACGHIFKADDADFDIIILDVKFPINPTKKRQKIMETAKALFVDAFAGDEEERPQIEDVFGEILLKEDYSGLLLFYLICLHYERQKGCWKLSDVGDSVCFFTGNEVGLDHFQSLLREQFSNGYRLREGRMIREYVDHVRGNFWQKGDGDEELKDFVEKVPYAAILRRNIGVKASEAFIHLLDKKDSDKPEEITENLGMIRNIFDNILGVIAKKLNAPDWCRNRKNPDQMVMRAVIGWIISSNYDKEKKKTIFNYQFGSNSLIKNFLFDIQEIASDFGPHKDLTPKPSGYQATSDTINSLFYALKDLIRWFGEICDRQP